MTVSFSVVVPTFDRPDALTGCLQALADQDISRDRYEVVVVDDGSPDPRRARRAVAAVASRIQARLLRQSNAGPAAARNAGARAARHGHVAFTDDDCRPTSTWLSGLAAAAERDPEVMLGGRTVNTLVDNPYAAASQVLVDYLYRHHRTRRDEGFFTSNNMAVPRGAFLGLGGFDASFPLPGGEDRELGDRWVHRGGRLRWVPTAVVEHARDMGPWGFLQQHVRYGQGAWRFDSVRARRTARRLRVRHPGFYLDMLGYPRRLGRPRAWLVAGLLALAQVATAVGYAREALSDRLTAQ